MYSLQVRIDENLKQKADEILNDMGLDLTTAVRIFLTQVVNTNSIPFDIKGKTTTEGR